MPSRLYYVVAATIALLALSMPARAQLEKTSMALPAIAPIFALSWVAQDAGIYKDAGLDVTEQVVRGVGATNAVISGSVDFSFSSGSTLTRAAAKDQPLIAIATPYDRTGFWIILNKKVADERHFDPKAPLSERAKVLKGLRFAIGSLQTSQHAYLNAIAKLGGLDPQNDLIVAPITLPDTLPAMQTGTIDGASVGPPVVAQALEAGAVIVADGTTGNPVDPPWLTRIESIVVVVRKDTCANRKSVCEKMGAAMAKAAIFFHDHPKETAAIMGKRLNFTDNPQILEDMYEVTAESTPRVPTVSAAGLETSDQLNVEAGFMPADQKLKSYDKLFDNEFVVGDAR